MHAFIQYGCVDGVPVDIHCMKSHLSAPDFTSRRGEAGNSKDTFNDSETEVWLVFMKSHAIPTPVLLRRDMAGQTQQLEVNAQR